MRCSPVAQVSPATLCWRSVQVPCSGPWHWHRSIWQSHEVSGIWSNSPRVKRKQKPPAPPPAQQQHHGSQPFRVGSSWCPRGTLDRDWVLVKNPGPPRLVFRVETGIQALQDIRFNAALVAAWAEVPWAEGPHTGRSGVVARFRDVRD